MGGGAIRTAAKAAALAGYRSTAARRSPSLNSSAAASTVHVAQEGESTPLIMSSNKIESGKLQIPVWDMDNDWEDVSGLVFDPIMDPPPRLVFGPVPSFEEAKEATGDLKEAIDQVYFTGAAEETVKASSQVSDLSGAAAIIPKMPAHVAQAFSLLQGCPEAQSVVASIASDPNVWNAVMKNDKVVEFYNKQQSVTLPNEESDSTGENEISESVNSPKNEIVRGFTDFVQNVKTKVSEMVSNISVILQDFMAPSDNNSQNATATHTDTGKGIPENVVDLAMGASFIALAVAAILVVLVKRG